MSASAGPTAADPLLEQAVDEAIAWAVRLASGMATDADRAACEAWRRSHALHDMAWQQVQAIETQFTLPATQGRLAHGALQAVGPRPARGRRQALQRLLGLATVTALLGALAWRWAPPREHLALATAPGQRRSTRLVDGSLLHLAPATEARVDFTLLRRVVHLSRGEVFIDTGKDPDSLAGRRPLWVETPLARFEALGTRFGVRHEDGATRLYVTEGRVAIHTQASAAVVIAGPGDSYVLQGPQAAVRRLPDEGAVPDAWTDGVLVARRMRLDAFVAELARQGGKAVACAPEVAALRVSGVFQLDGADPVGRALAAIARTLPVRVQKHGDGLLLARAS